MLKTRVKTFDKCTQTTDWNYELVSLLHLIWLLYKVSQYLGPGIRSRLVTPLHGIYIYIYIYIYIAIYKCAATICMHANLSMQNSSGQATPKPL